MVAPVDKTTGVQKNTSSRTPPIASVRTEQAMDRRSKRQTRLLPRFFLVLSALVLSGCSDFRAFSDKIGLTRPVVEQAVPVALPAARPTKPRDIETPDAFQVTAPAVWDGRPSFGEIWVSVPDAPQPERVIIRNEETGETVRGGMLVALASESGTPIRLSSKAAAALGVEMRRPVELTITAVRAETSAPEAPRPRPVEKTEPATTLAASDPALPTVVDRAPPALVPVEDANDGYLEVAQAVFPSQAELVQSELRSAAIAAEIQEDYVDGQSLYRVFAPDFGQTDQLYGALAAVQFTAEAEGSDDGLLLAELPNFDRMNEPDGIGEVWVEFGAYPSRNEAIAVRQRLSRRDIPTLFCEKQHGYLQIHRVFAGPAGDTGPALDALSFCAGVAAADALEPYETQEQPAPILIAETGADLVEPLPKEATGSVRIKVGEATGDLKLRIPNPFSVPIEIDVEGIKVMISPDVTPELLDRIKTALGRI